MKLFLESKNGITLIALVITIIVLLILAGVTISVLTGENGLLTKTKESVILTEVGEIIDKTKLNSMKDEGVIQITGKLENVDIGLSDELIEKYNEILYIKNSEVYLDFIADFPDAPLYKKIKRKLKY